MGRDESVLTKGDVDVSERVAQLHDAHGLATKRADKDFIASRIASLTGGVGVIEVGGYTDLEQKELYDRVDDAVCAVKAAMSDGVLPGGVGVIEVGGYTDLEQKELYDRVDDACLLYTSPSPRDRTRSRMPSSA